MNNITLSVTITTPELRYTQENQTPVCQFIAEFPGAKPEDPTQSIKCTAWGNLGSEVQSSYGNGDKAIIEGRLKIETIERPEGFKEKRAELVVSRMHKIGGFTPTKSSPATNLDKYKSPSPDAVADQEIGDDLDLIPF